MSIACEIAISVVNINDKTITAGTGVALATIGTPNIGHLACCSSNNCLETSIVVAIVARITPAPSNVRLVTPKVPTAIQVPGLISRIGCPIRANCFECFCQAAVGSISVGRIGMIKIRGNDTVATTR
jgi:hypothetical protein